MKEKLLKIVDKFKDKKIMVIGDMVLDEYWYGTIGRVSREAPVLILEYEDSNNILGGAANAVHNVQTLGATVLPVSILGLDDSSNKILNFFKDRNIDRNTVVIDESHHTMTPTKIRIMAGCVHTARQQVLRIDKKSKEKYSQSVEEKLKTVIKDNLSNVDAVLVSDYGLGVLSDNIISYINDLFENSKVPMIVDSRYKLNKYRHVTLVTPNDEEAELAADMKIEKDGSNLENISKKLFNILESKGGIIITLGKDGMALYNNSKFIKIPIVGAKEAVDVTGAGDTVSAVVTLAVASGASFEEAMNIANMAASLVVMKRGNAVLSIDELKGVIRSVLI